MERLDLYHVLPEILLALFTFGALMLGVFRPKSTRLIFRASILLLLLLSLIYALGSDEVELFNRMLIDDGFSRALKILIVLSSAAVLLSARNYLERVGLYVMELPLLMLLSVLGMIIMVMARNLLVLYIGIELQSLALYVLAAYRRDNARSSEAGMKYFALGALSSGLFLFGASLVYGFSGALDYDQIAASLGPNPGIGMTFGLAFLAAAIAFKLSAAPFHMWTPDVYQGAPTAITAFFASAPKIASAGMLARLAYEGFAGAMEAWSQILALLALLSLLVGAIGGIGQRNIKRLLAYSSILNMGFILIAIAAGGHPDIGAEAVEALIIYLAIYVTATIGSFALIMSMERDGREVVEIHELGQLSARAPLAGLGVLLLMFSVAGIPPLAGFLAKYVVLMSAVRAGLAWLAIIAVIASLLAAFYYLRIVYLVYFGEEPEREHERNWSLAQGLVFALASLLMILWTFKFFGISGLAQDAAMGLF